MVPAAAWVTAATTSILGLQQGDLLKEEQQLLLHRGMAKRVKGDMVASSQLVPWVGRMRLDLSRRMVSGPSPASFRYKTEGGLPVRAPHLASVLVEELGGGVIMHVEGTGWSLGPGVKPTHGPPGEEISFMKAMRARGPDCPQWSGFITGFSEKSVLGLSKTWCKMLSGISRDVQNFLGFLGKDQGRRKGGIRVGWGRAHKGK